MRVLVVDDSLLARMILHDAVMDLGHECLTARDGAEAWRLLAGQEIDVVVSDWVMPGFDGYELCQRVRTRTDAPYVYFVFLTILRDATHAVNGLKAGADHYLPKPLDPSELAATLHTAAEVLELHRRRRMLIEIAQRLAVERDPGQLLPYVVEQARRLLTAETACIYTTGRERDGRMALLERAATSGPTAEWPCQMTVAATELSHGAHILIAPIAHGGRSLGLLSVAADPAGRPFDTGASAALAVLAAMTAAVVINAERTELIQVVMTARELTHLLNNKLGTAVGTLDLIAQERSLSPGLQELALIANGELEVAADRIHRFQTQVRSDEARPPRPRASVRGATEQARLDPLPPGVSNW